MRWIERCRTRSRSRFRSGLLKLAAAGEPEIAVQCGSQSSGCSCARTGWRASTARSRSTVSGILRSRTTVRSLNRSLRRAGAAARNASMRAFWIPHGWKFFPGTIEIDRQERQALVRGVVAIRSPEQAIHLQQVLRHRRRATLLVQGAKRGLGLHRLMVQRRFVDALEDAARFQQSWSTAAFSSGVEIGKIRRQAHDERLVEDRLAFGEAPIAGWQILGGEP